MVMTINEAALAQLPMQGGAIEARFVDADDLRVQWQEFIPNQTLFINAQAHPRPFSEFSLTLRMPDGRAAEPVPARLVQIISHGPQAGLVVQLLGTPPSLGRLAQENLDAPAAKPAPRSEPPAERGRDDREPPASAEPAGTAKPKKAANLSSVERQSLHQKLRKMNITERARLAHKADRLTRTFLIRDHEPQVILFLLGNPRLTRQEALEISRSKAITHQSALKLLANKRWSQSEELRYNLVMNPKTPLQTAVKLMPTLNMRHLREIAKNNGVKEQLKRSALRIVLERAG